MLAIESGRIDTAVVAGVNVLASPVMFVAFAQASMLSPRGLDARDFTLITYGGCWPLFTTGVTHLLATANNQA